MAMVAAVTLFHDREASLLVNRLELELDELIERLRAHYGRQAGERILGDRNLLRSIRLADHWDLWPATRRWYAGTLEARWFV